MSVSDAEVAATATADVADPTPVAEDLRSKILSAKGRREQLVDVPEWGCTVLVKTMMGRERAQFVERGVRADGHIDPERGPYELAVRCAYDPKTGRRIFRMGDIETLLDEHDGIGIERIFLVAVDLNGFGDAAKEKVAANLPAAQNGTSTSPS